MIRTSHLEVLEHTPARVNTKEAAAAHHHEAANKAGSRTRLDERLPLARTSETVSEDTLRKEAARHRSVFENDSCEHHHESVALFLMNDGL